MVFFRFATHAFAEEVLVVVDLQCLTEVGVSTAEVHLALNFTVTIYVYRRNGTGKNMLFVPIPTARYLLKAGVCGR